MPNYRLAARLIAQVQRAGPSIVLRAGARHSGRDTEMIQQVHDAACELGAKCKGERAEMMTVEEMRRYAPNPMLKAAVEALVLRHPGHGNQKVHGNRFGAGQAKESLRRLKDDKTAREAYKMTARKKKEARRTGRRGEGTKAREEFDFLNRRLAAGGLKRGERKLLERRLEQAARKIFGV